MIKSSKGYIRKLFAESNLEKIDGKQIIDGITNLSENVFSLTKNSNLHYKELNNLFQSIYSLLQKSSHDNISLSWDEIKSIQKIFVTIIDKYDDYNSAECLISLSLCLILSLKLGEYSANETMNLILLKVNQSECNNDLSKSILKQLMTQQNFYLSFCNAFLSVYSLDLATINMMELLVKITDKKAVQLNFVGFYIKSVLFRKLSDVIGRNIELSKCLLSHVIDQQSIKQSAIRTNNQYILSKVLKLHKETCELCLTCKYSCGNVKLVFDNILSQSWFNFSKFYLLACFVREFSYEFVQNYEPNLLEILLKSSQEYSLWSYIGELIIAIVNSTDSNVLKDIFEFGSEAENFLCDYLMSKLSQESYEKLKKNVLSLCLSESDERMNRFCLVSIHYLCFLSKRKKITAEEKESLMNFVFSNDRFGVLSTDRSLITKDAMISIITKEILATKGREARYWEFLMEFVRNNVKEMTNKSRQHYMNCVKNVLVGIPKDNVNYVRFIRNFYGFLIANFYPGASLHKVNCIMNYFQVLMNSGPRFSDVLCINENELQYFFNVLTYYFADSFKENRHLSTNIFSYLSISYPQHPYDYSSLAKIAFDKAFSSNPNDSPIASLIMTTLLKLGKPADHEYDKLIGQIWHKLNENLEKIYTNIDLIDMATQHPFYSTLYCICELVQRDINHFAELIDFYELYRVCMRIFDLIYPIISSGAPEGYTIDLCAQDQAVVCSNYSEYLVVCCWRTCKEISRVLGYMGSFYVAEKQWDRVSMVCQFFSKNISSVSHKGAFESLTNGMEMLVAKIWGSEFESYLWSMIQESLDIITGKQNVFYTRRSAGLPHLFRVLITGEVSGCERRSFSVVTNQLKEILDGLNLTTGEGDLNTLIHIFNILRLLFKEGLLSNQIATITLWSLRYSIKYFNYHVWSVKNSATLLFCAIIERIFGPSKSANSTIKYNKLNSKVFFNKYPGMYEYMTKSIQQHCGLNKPQLTDSVAMYPFFVLLSRLIPEPDVYANQQYHLEIFQNASLRYLSSPIWIVRCSSAHSFGSLLTSQNFLQFSLDNIENTSFSLDKNLVHGTIKSISLFLLENEDFLSIDYDLLQQSLCHLATTWNHFFGNQKRRGFLTEESLLDLCLTTETLLSIRRSDQKLRLLWEQYLNIEGIREALISKKHITVGMVKCLGIFVDILDDDFVLKIIGHINDPMINYQVKSELYDQLCSTHTSDKFLSIFFLYSPIADFITRYFTNHNQLSTLNQSLLIQLVQFITSIIQSNKVILQLEQAYHILSYSFSILIDSNYNHVRIELDCSLLYLVTHVLVHLFHNQICPIPNVVNEINKLINVLLEFSYYDNDDEKRNMCAKCCNLMVCSMILSQVTNQNSVDNFNEILLVGLNDENADVRNISFESKRLLFEKDGPRFQLNYFGNRLGSLGYRSDNSESSRNHSQVVFESDEINFYYDFVDVVKETVPICKYRKSWTKACLFLTDLSVENMLERFGGSSNTVIEFQRILLED